MFRIALTLALSAALGLTACTSARPVARARACVDWKSEIAPLLAESCGTCHGAESALGGYRVTSYLDVIADGGGERMLMALDPQTADATHAPLTALHPTLRTWVVDCQLSYADSQVHERGIMNPVSKDFHGTLLAERAWDFPLCQKCHGADFAGGKAQSSCLTCHEKSPTGCTTCHGAPPETGSHAAHATQGTTCDACHRTPSAWSDPGHILDRLGAVDPAPAEVTFGKLAEKETATDVGLASYTDGKCSSVYCHGPAQPTWGNAADGACGSCHGTPPAAHPGGACLTCHPRVVDELGGLRPGVKHVNGSVSLGDESGSCLACHRVLSGAHDRHSEGPSHLAAPIACVECHRVPQTVTEPGHLSADGSATVFPAGSGSMIATAFSAQPTWNATTKTCADVHCHGGGTKLAVDQAPGVVRVADWTQGASQAACGVCHGVPPVDGVHSPTWRLQRCYQCHPSTMDSSGALHPATHINGVVDAL